MLFGPECPQCTQLATILHSKFEGASAGHS